MGYMILSLSASLTFGSDQRVPQLDLLCPSHVNESDTFAITVTIHGSPVDNVTVTFIDQTNLTNSSGQATLRAPRVPPHENSTFLLSVSKQGYNATTCRINVTNVPQLFPVVTTSSLIEESEFVITVIDDQGRIVDNATLLFLNKQYWSDKNGNVILTAPCVNNSQLFSITALKSGFLEYTISITVSPSISTPHIIGFYVVIGICLFIVVLSLSILIYKYKEKKRINRY
jgi:hypothetical protein